MVAHNKEPLSACCGSQEKVIEKIWSIKFVADNSAPERCVMETHLEEYPNSSVFSTMPVWGYLPLGCCCCYGVGFASGACCGWQNSAKTARLQHEQIVYAHQTKFAQYCETVSPPGYAPPPEVPKPSYLASSPLPPLPGATDDQTRYCEKCGSSGQLGQFCKNDGTKYS